MWSTLKAAFWSFPQAALGRQCPQPWSTSLVSTCTAWLFPTFPAVANLTSCSRSTALTATPSPRPFGRCSAAPPMRSNLFPSPAPPASPVLRRFQTRLDWYNTQFFQSPLSPSPRCECPPRVCTEVLWFLCCTLWLVSRLPSCCASITSLTQKQRHTLKRTHILTHSSVLKVNDLLFGGQPLHQLRHIYMFIMNTGMWFPLFVCLFLNALSWTDTTENVFILIDVTQHKSGWGKVKSKCLSWQREKKEIR